MDDYLVQSCGVRGSDIYLVLHLFEFFPVVFMVTCTN